MCDQQGQLVATAAPYSARSEGKGHGRRKTGKKGVFWLFTSSYFSGEGRTRNVKFFRLYPLFHSWFFGYFLLEIWNNLGLCRIFFTRKSSFDFF